MFNRNSLGASNTSARKSPVPSLITLSLRSGSSPYHARSRGDSESVKFVYETFLDEACPTDITGRPSPPKLAVPAKGFQGGQFRPRAPPAEVDRTRRGQQ